MGVLLRFRYSNPHRCFVQLNKLRSQKACHFLTHAPKVSKGKVTVFCYYLCMNSLRLISKRFCCSGKNIFHGPLFVYFQSQKLEAKLDRTSWKTVSMVQWLCSDPRRQFLLQQIYWTRICRWRSRLSFPSRMLRKAQTKESEIQKSENMWNRSRIKFLLLKSELFFSSNFYLVLHQPILCQSTQFKVKRLH